MVIQGYNVTVSSQRTSLAVQTATATATGSAHAAQMANSQGQGIAAPAPNSSQGQNQNGQGQNVNNQGQNQNGQGQNVNNQGQNQNDQGQNVNNQGQSNGDIFKSLLNRAKGNRVDRSAEDSPASRFLNSKNFKQPTNPTELRATLSKLIYEMLTGRFKTFKQQGMEHIGERQRFDISFFFGGAFETESVQRPQGAELWNIQSFQYESETVSYQANGVVHTADGKTIHIDINMSMSREFVSFMNMSGEGGRLVDPLVINYGGTAASLMSEKFLFDLTMDGNMDSLSVLAEGSGFLAIDRNGDGIINDGSELFGPSTGCGFSELRKYDTDGNGWIDANDEIFDKLVVWSRDKDGNDKVYTLAELGIGAIFLGDISTEFSFKNESNETLGVMRSTSFFLKHCGGAGTLSHIDLAM